METKDTNEGFFSRIISETKKPDFQKALAVFIGCAIGGVALGLVFGELQLGAAIGVGLGLVWMGVAYFNQEDE